jgi:hypothetical protein
MSPWSPVEIAFLVVIVGSFTAFIAVLLAVSVDAALSERRRPAPVRAKPGPSSLAAPSHDLA